MVIDFLFNNGGTRGMRSIGKGVEILSPVLDHKSSLRSDQ